MNSSSSGSGGGGGGGGRALVEIGLTAKLDLLRHQIGNDFCLAQEMQSCNGHEVIQGTLTSVSSETVSATVGGHTSSWETSSFIAAFEAGWYMVYVRR